MISLNSLFIYLRHIRELREGIGVEGGGGGGIWDGGGKGKEGKKGRYVFVGGRGYRRGV